MSKDLHKGDRVQCNSHGGKKSANGRAVGEIVEKVTSERTIRGHTAKAKKDERQYVVHSDKGGEAAHTPEALHQEN